MTIEYKKLSNSFKIVLYLAAGTFAVAAALLIMFAAAAAGGEGSSPAEAMVLTAAGHQDSLAPGEQHWLAFTVEGQAGQALEIEKTLSLIFTPDDGNIIRFVSLNIFEQDQVQFFDQGDTGQMLSFGSGQIAALDGLPETGELFWMGSVAAGNTYYVQVLNNSDFLISYRLSSTGDISPPPAVPAEESAGSVAVPSAEVPAEPAAISDLGSSPGLPAPLESGLNRGTVKPHSTYWYSFRQIDFSGQKRFHEMDMTMFFTPDDGNRRHHVNFQLYPFSEYEIWRRGDTDKLTNFGAGMLVSRDGDHNTGERTWRGVVVNGDSYLMAIENNTDVEIEYWVFDDDIYNPELGPKPEPAPQPVFAQGAAPQTATPLKLGVNKGGLDPGEETWFSFRISNFDDQLFEQMGLTMVTTPDDGNRIRHMTFDVFTADGARNWSPGDNSRINNIGAGTVVFRDDNPLTGERHWSGWVVDNDLYYVQIRNGTDVHMDYWLFTGDVYRPELGEQTQVAARPAAEPGAEPTVPMDLRVGINEGQLAPRQERWYVFSRGDVSKGGSVDTAFTMIFTPDDGNRVRQVSFELFEGRELSSWAPDNRFNMNHFGQGTVVSRDGNPKTGEMVWTGHLLVGDQYYMRVYNESEVMIDYQIYPDNVINTQLGQ